jgi:hypothetical protein
VAHDGDGLDDDGIAVFSRTDGVSLEDTIVLCWAQSRQDLDGSLGCTRLD